MILYVNIKLWEFVLHFHKLLPYTVTIYQYRAFVVLQKSEHLIISVKTAFQSQLKFVHFSASTLFASIFCTGADYDFFGAIWGKLH